MALDYNLVTIRGGIGTVETWNVGCAYNTNFGTGPVKDFADLDAWATAIAAMSGTAYPSLMQAMSTSGTIQSIRVAYIDSSGVTAQLAEAPTTSWVGTSAGKTPFQAAIVLSLMTGRPGRSFRGRMYWPAWGLQVQTDLTIVAATVAAIAANAAAMITDIGTAAGADFAMQPVVNSKVLGTTNPVTSVRVGNILDTQRRRRNQAVETYQASVVPPA